MLMEEKVWIFDLEQYENFHSGTFVNRDAKNDVRVLVIHETRDDIAESYKFI